MRHAEAAREAFAARLELVERHQIAGQVNGAHIFVADDDATGA